MALLFTISWVMLIAIVFKACCNRHLILAISFAWLVALGSAESVTGRESLIGTLTVIARWTVIARLSVTVQDSNPVEAIRQLN